MATIRVCEIFGPTIQGEGALVGRPTVFVRTGGCDFRCSWCDSLYAVLPQYRDEWKPMTAEEILAEVERLSGGHPILVTVSGGNPALQPLAPLLELGRSRGHSFALETQGTAAPDWLAQLDHLVLSPKPPSSGMAFSAETLRNCLQAAAALVSPPAPAATGTRPHVSLKVVVFDEADYQFARGIAQMYPGVPFFLSVGNPAPGADSSLPEGELTHRLEWLLERMAQDGWFTPTLLPQLHVLLWGNKRGV